MEDRSVGRQHCGGETGEAAGSFEPRLMPGLGWFRVLQKVFL